MKISLKYLIVFCMLTASFPLRAQEPGTTYTKSLKEVLTTVEKKFNVKLYYPEELAEREKVKYASWRFTTELKSTLDNILKPLDLGYYFEPSLKQYRITPYEYYRRSEEDGKKELDYLLTLYSNAEQFDKRKAELRKCIEHALGINLSIKRTPLNPIIRSKVVMKGYTVENVAFESFPGFFVTGNLYRPSKRKGTFPVILSPHGHFTGTPGEHYMDTTGRFTPDLQSRCAGLAKMGAIVFSYDMYSWGESIQQTGNASYHHNSVASSIQTWNSIRALDFLFSLPNADPARAGVTGASGGGTQTMLVAALDERITASAPIVMMSSTFYGGCECESGLPIHGDCNGQKTNNTEIAAIISPRPLLVISDGSDWTKAVPEIDIPYLKKVYGFYGKESNIENVHLPDDQHDYGISKRIPMYSFFAKALGLNLSSITGKDGNIDETGITIQKSKDMLAFPATNPLPANALKSHESIVQSFRQQFISQP